MRALIGLAILMSVVFLGYQFFYMFADMSIACSHVEPVSIQCKHTTKIFSLVVQEEQSLAKNVLKAEIQRTIAPKSLHLSWVLKDGGTQEIAAFPGRSSISSMKVEVEQLTRFSQDPTAPIIVLEVPSYGLFALLSLAVVFLIFYLKETKKRRSTSRPSP